MTNNHSEIKALKLSMFGSLFFAVLGLGFALLTNSRAILFDGVYSLAFFAVAYLTVKVAEMSQKPDDEYFHFGYAQLEPLLNVFKGLFILGACVSVIISSIQLLGEDGSSIETEFAVAYGFISTSACAGYAFYLRRMASKTGSKLLLMDATDWMVDTLLSASVLLGFIAAYVFRESPHVNLFDPALTMIMALVAMPLTLKQLLSNGRELIGMAPDKEYQQDIQQAVEKALDGYDLERVVIRILKRGRDTFLLTHAIVGPGFKVDSIEELDAIRHHVNKAVVGLDTSIELDLLFVKDPQWAGVA